jgi:hypothetical protein
MPWGFAVSKRLKEETFAVQGGRKPSGFWALPEVKAILAAEASDEAKAAALKTTVLAVRWYVNKEAKAQGYSNAREAKKLAEARAEIRSLEEVGQ